MASSVTMENGKPKVENTGETKVEETKTNAFFSKHDGYILRTYNAEKKKWLQLYTSPDMGDRSNATWSLNEIKNIVKNKMAFGQVCIDTCGYNPVWQLCMIDINKITVEHDGYIMIYLSEMPPP